MIATFPVGTLYRAQVRYDPRHGYLCETFRRSDGRRHITSMLDAESDLAAVWAALQEHGVTDPTVKVRTLVPLADLPASVWYVGEIRERAETPFDREEREREENLR